ncbi:MAG: hypothetical protein MZV63_68910 [Marinilabiliales bacterium]|nr:hypothetical protein [Marinilabiliales bacterium]
METVRRIYTLLILVALPIMAGAQEKVVTGIIQDNRGFLSRVSGYARSIHRTAPQLTLTASFISSWIRERR